VTTKVFVCDIGSEWFVYEQGNCKKMQCCLDILRGGYPTFSAMLELPEMVVYQNVAKL
jgi:hypothetical protein